MNRINRLTKKRVKRVAPLGLGSHLAGSLAAGPVIAGSTTMPLSISADVIENCLITMSPIIFTGYDPVGTHKHADPDGQGSVTITCASGTVASIKLGLGSHEASGPRQMVAAIETDALKYNLYSDPTRTLPGMRLLM